MFPESSSKTSSMRPDKTVSASLRISELISSAASCHFEKGFPGMEKILYTDMIRKQMGD